MRRIIILAAFILFIPGLLQAQEPKIGLVDLQYILEKCAPGQKAIEQLQQEFQGMQQTLDQRKSELDALREELQKQSLILSQEAQSDKETEFRQKMQDFQKLYQDYQRRMQAKEQELREPIIDKLVEVIQDYGQKNEFDMVLDKQNSGIVYNTPELEITEPVLDLLNQKWQTEND